MRRTGGGQTAAPSGADGFFLPLAKAGLGRSPGGVLLEPGSLEIRHSLLRAPFQLPVSGVASMVQAERADLTEWKLRRQARLLDLTAGRAGLWLVLAQPYRVGGFRFGADRALGLTSRERRSGLDVDAVGLRFDDPGPLRDALSRAGVDSHHDFDQALVAVVGAATGEESARRRRASGRRRLLIGAALAALVVARLGLLSADVVLNDGARDIHMGGEGSKAFPTVTGTGRVIAVPDELTLDATPEAAFAVPDNPAETIDGPTAERVFRALYPAYTLGVYYKNERTVRAVTTGASEAWELAYCRQLCETPPMSSAGVSYTFSAPPQQGYPAFFVARVSRAGALYQAVAEIVIFRREDRDTPWQIALATGTDTVNPLLESGNAGLDKPVPQPPGPAAASLPDELARYFQHWADTGSAPAAPRFGDDPGLEERGRDIAADVGLDRRGGIALKKTYRADPEVWTVKASDQGAVTCGVLHITNVFTPTRGSLAQPNRTFELPLVEPGRYRRVELHAVDQVCFLVAADGTAQTFWSTPAVVSADTTRAP